jgi:hypothetical protein
MRYLKGIRPVLLGSQQHDGSGRHLEEASDRGPLLSDRSRAVTARFGRAMGVHDFRRAASSLKGTMNALFFKDLALKIRRGQRGRVEAGKIPGGSSYGYRIIRQLGADGSVSTGE